MVKKPWRFFPVFLPTVNRTVPFPLPLPPPVIEIQLSLELAVQEQPMPADTLKDPEPPASSIFTSFGETE